MASHNSTAHIMVTISPDGKTSVGAAMAMSDSPGSTDKKAGLPTEDIETASSSLSLEERNEREIVEHPNEITDDAQTGVKKAEAVALVWSTAALYYTYAWICLCFFILALQSSVGSNMMYYAYADFSSAPQISQAYIIGSIISGVIQLPIAKTLNLWGRAEGFLVVLTVYLVGIIILASCNGAKSFAAGYTIYYIGYTSVNFILSIFVADSAGLRNRAFAYAFIGTPSICTAFTGSLIAQAFYEHSTWRWSYGCFVIIVFFTFTPLTLVLKFYQRKAEKMGLYVRTRSGRTTWQSVVHYFYEFDLVGGFFLMAVFVLLLLPFSLEIYGYGSYSSPTFICMIVFGAVLLPVFALWERFMAKTAFVKWELFKKRTVVGACVLSAVIFFNYAAWDTYYYYYLQVVYNLNTAKTGYMNQIYSVGSTIWAVLFGVWIRQTKYFKKVCLFFGAPLLVLGAGLMVHFRGSDSKIGYLIMCQILIAFGGGTLVIGDEMAAMAAADREGIPMVIALISLFGSLGGAIGYAVAVAIYSNTFPSALLKALPDDTKADYLTIYLGGSTTQLLYPIGTAARTAIDYAWTESQKYLCIAAVSIVGLAFLAVAIWKNYDVDRRQVKGLVL
ncbi:siderochrome-iron transporter [Grosmannia clavigera kw1407]|uniref:Siderochrome-iron transporter n=1 Tax=Grosmannia clavigera (strain kw1407 / UAMH 11150) TaxID=655863 RepID=F0XA07_GROCL|nr:siderochrome-iron transporter [Grosmannia clavigera kw1407]EFX05726.1 siderochrome-iron transporter [Grosmannia clavigera kw1407]